MFDVQGVMCGILISMATVLAVTINAQYHTAMGNLHYEIIPTSTEGCANSTIATYVLYHWLYNFQADDHKYTTQNDLLLNT